MQLNAEGVQVAFEEWIDFWPTRQPHAKSNWVDVEMPEWLYPRAFSGHSNSTGGTTFFGYRPHKQSTRDLLEQEGSLTDSILFVGTELNWDEPQQDWYVHYVIKEYDESNDVTGHIELRIPVDPALRIPPKSTMPRITLPDGSATARCRRR
ncbi:MAG: hypothetical protein AAGB34_10460 [Planctomycetota bacterium]